MIHTDLEPITDIKQQKSVLTAQEWDIWQHVVPQKGTLMLQGPPGAGKSYIIEEIARKLNFKFHDFALTHLDSADLGGLPDIDRVSREFPVLKYAINDWAVAANEGPTIIFLDEMNRPSEDIINALLKVLDKRLGLNYRLNHNVYIISAGNLGIKEDGTTVSALDAAMNNRLIHYKFNPTLEEWVTNFAEGRVHPLIISFLQTDEGHSHFRQRKHDAAAFTTARSWTNLSDFLIFHGYIDLEKTAKIITTEAIKYIGTYSATAFITYLTALMSTPIPSMSEILKKGKKLKNDLKDLNLVQKAYIVNSFKIETLHNTKEKDISTFISILPDDLIALMYSRIITNAVKTSIDSIMDPSKKHYTVNQIIEPYLNVLNVNRSISNKLLESTQ